MPDHDPSEESNESQTPAVERASDDYLREKFIPKVAASLLIVFYLNDLSENLAAAEKLTFFALPTTHNQITYGLRADLTDQLSLGMTMTERNFQNPAMDAYYSLRIEYQF